MFTNHHLPKRCRKKRGEEVANEPLSSNQVLGGTKILDIGNEVSEGLLKIIDSDWRFLKVPWRSLEVP